MSATVNMLDHLSEWTGKMAMTAIEMNEGVKKIVEQLPTDKGDHTSHNQQNN